MFSTILALALMGVGQQPDAEMEASVRVNPKAPSSGTVVKVVDENAYVISTGHMSIREDVKVEFFYMNGKKLATPTVLQGKVLLLVENNERGVDFSLIVVKLPDRTAPTAVQLADNRGNLKPGLTYRAVGCKMGKEPSEYNVVYEKEVNGSIITSKDEVQAGASGGGMFRSGKLYGVAWGSSTDKNGTKGMFVSHHTIIKCLEAAGFKHLLE